MSQNGKADICVDNTCQTMKIVRKANVTHKKDANVWRQKAVTCDSVGITGSVMQVPIQA